MQRETNRGRPLPFALREQIKARIIGGASVSATARIVGVSRPTVLKYRRKPS